MVFTCSPPKRDLSDDLPRKIHTTRPLSSLPEHSILYSGLWDLSGHLQRALLAAISPVTDLETWWSRSQACVIRLERVIGTCKVCAASMAYELSMILYVNTNFQPWWHITLVACRCNQSSDCNESPSFVTMAKEYISGTAMTIIPRQKSHGYVVGQI